MLSRPETVRENFLAIIFLLLMVPASVYFLTTPYYYLALLPGLAALFLFVIGKKAHNAYLLIIFLIPFQQYTALAETYRFLTISKLLGGLLLLLTAITVLVRKIELSRFGSNLWPLLIIFFLINLLATIVSDYPVTAVDFLRRLSAQYAFFLLGLFFFGRKQLLSTLPWVLISSISISSALSVYGYFFDSSYFAMNIEADTVKRALGASNDPNFFCMMIIFCLPVLAHRYFTLERNSGRWLLGGLLLLNLAAVVLTYSRSGAMVLAIMLLLLSWEYRRRFRPLYLGFFGLFLLAVLVGTAVLVPASYWERQKSITNVSEERSLGRRVSYLSVATEVFVANPILGTGPGTFRDYYEKSQYALEFSREGKTDRRAAHNAYVEVAVGTGMLGLVVFLLLVFVAWRNFHMAHRSCLQRNDQKTAALIRTYRLCYVSFLLALLVLSAQFHKYFWLALLLSQVCLILSRQADEADSRVEQA